MENQAMGVVISVTQQGWLKFNTKPARVHSLDGSIFPHTIKVKFEVDGREYICKHWIDAGSRVPDEGEQVRVRYSVENPHKATVEF